MKESLIEIFQHVNCDFVSFTLMLNVKVNVKCIIMIPRLHRVGIQMKINFNIIFLEIKAHQKMGLIFLKIR